MTQRDILSRLVAGGAATLSLIAPSAGAAPQVTAEQEAKIVQSSLVEGARVRMVEDTALDRAKAGYYRINVTLGSYPKKSFCWETKAERDAIAKAASSLWSFALKRKKDWGASVQLTFDGSRPDYDSATYKPNIWIKLFTVNIDGASPDKCLLKSANFSTYESPLIAMDTTGTTNATYVRFSSWYNDISDRDRISRLYKGGTTILGVFGLPVGLLQNVESDAVDEIKAKLDKNRTSDLETQLSPFDGKRIAVDNYVGLREPPETPTNIDPKVTVKLVPVASIFDQEKTSFDQLDLSGATPGRILKLPIKKSPESAELIYLDNAIDAKTRLLKSMLEDANDAGASSTCDLLAMTLMNDMRLSSTDTAILLWAAVKQRMASGITKHLRDVACLANHEAALKRVKIELPAKAAPPAAAVPISKTDMLDRMNTLSQFRVAEADAVPSANWSIFAFPLTVYDATDKLGLENQQATFSADTRAGLKSLFDTNGKGLGCWAYFDGDNFQFAPGLGGPDPAKGIRKSAALFRLKNDDVIVLQLRYNGDPAGQKVDGMAFTRVDAAARALMLGNDNCKADVAGREWMQKFLRP